MSGSETISPTAHYTGFVWARHGLSHPALETLEGRVLFESLRPLMTINAALGRGTLESYLLARHRAIDASLERQIEKHGIRQVIEVAAGLSPRSWRFVKRYPKLTYVDVDLPGMAARKRQAVERMNSDPKRHMVRELNVLQEDEIVALAAELDPEQGLVIVTEGLLPYLASGQVKAIWRQFARTLSGFARGTYVSDIHVGSVEGAPERVFRMLLSLFVRGRVYLHFGSTEEVVAALEDAGFAGARVQAAEPAAADRARRVAHILEAWSR